MFLGTTCVENSEEDMIKQSYIKNIKHYPDALSVAEVSEILRVCSKTVYKMINVGTIPAVKVGRENRILKNDLVRYLRANIA